MVGSWLADNPALTLAPAAAQVLRSGQVDMRLATALAGLSSWHRLTIANFVAVPDEPADATRRVALVTEVDGKSTAVAGAADRAQQQLAGEPPTTRPASAAVEQGVLVVRYTVPSPADR